ncbi:hypothetical protein BP6252_06487 [Coleophoma cylindrospora]|uniref:HECT-type E3 ubiquitin transferase n=1 Tax=Coleophoma cylindrospora TaxID=1849047 RepID=A0A3D8RMR1_9HELO|nr:hypothetical protein BP6252_06487 [Coleophoma cylindrospora]
MTREVQEVHNEADELYAALWQSTLFPRLPHDAPPELKKLTVDIDDPKRVYTIHQASRRHNFQILVERYIIQLRYGCQVKNCTTPTCFSCRKRLANGAPVRRYNATSASTLAVYLASQDNPEQGLCQNPSVTRPPPQFQHVAKAVVNGLNSHTTVTQKSSPSKMSSPASSNSSKPTSSRQRSSEGHSQRKGAETVGRKSSGRKTRSPDAMKTVVEPSSKKDHKSFVQNMFGTRAFTALEWLSPQKLFLMSSAVSEEIEARTQKSGHNQVPAEILSTTKTDDQEHDMQTKEDNKTGTAPNTAGTTIRSSISGPIQKQNSDNEKAGQPALRVETSAKIPASLDKENTSTEKESTQNGDAWPEQPFTTPKLSSTKSRRPSRAGLGDTKITKGILNTPTSPRAQAFSPELLSRDSKPCKPKRQLSRHATVTSLSLDELESEVIESQLLPEPAAVQEDNVAAPNDLHECAEPDSYTDSTEFRETRNGSPKIHTKNDRPSRTSREPFMPQTLSHLSLDTIDFLCDILQDDEMTENHSLYPQTIPRTRRRFKDDHSHILRRRNSHLKDVGYPQDQKQKWSRFILQSLFDVLSRPDALIKSFSDSDGILLDTQTIWYLMLRMTRVAPSLVFHSLWLALGSAFEPPAEFETDLSKTDSKSARQEATPVSNNDAARLLTICLHALIAAAPQVSNARQLANMSRIRSYGLLPMLGRDSSNLEPMVLCLQYEDAFTDDRALRLARRLFAAISTRKRFSEVTELNRDADLVSLVKTQETNILEEISACINFGDVGNSALQFSHAERELHEKRIPTLIIDWARTVMMQDWQGSAEVPKNGSFGGALSMIAAIYDNRKSLLLGDIHFYSSYFTERLDSMQIPVDWLAFEPNRKTIHLLDYPYLFNPASLVTYFRSINYTRMSRAFEAARSEQSFVSHTSADKALLTDPIRRHKLFERLRLATSRFNVLLISRSAVLTDAFNQIWRREERELMRPLKIRLGEEGGEEGSDSGGVQQEFFRLAIAEALNPDYGTFTIDQRTKMTWFQPGSPEPLWKFELIGVLVSLAIYNGLTLPVTFPKALYRKLLGEQNTELHHIEDGWPDLASGLTTMLEWDEKDGTVEDVFTRTYEFSVEQFGQPVSRDMGKESYWPQFSDSVIVNASNTEAPLVTGSNRSDYVSDYISWLTDISVRPQFEAFKRGFFTCVTPRSVTLFTPEILQSVVEGVQEIDISDLRRFTRYVGWDASHKTVREFWSVVKRFDYEQKRKLLEFVTASDRVPVGGMRNLQFVVQRNGIGDEHLPTSYTCYGTLLLPEYGSKEVLREKLGMALENSKGFGFA